MNYILGELFARDKCYSSLYLLSFPKLRLLYLSCSVYTQYKPLLDCFNRDANVKNLLNVGNELFPWGQKESTLSVQAGNGIFYIHNIY